MAGREAHLWTDRLAQDGAPRTSHFRFTLKTRTRCCRAADGESVPGATAEPSVTLDLPFVGSLVLKPRVRGSRRRVRLTPSNPRLVAVGIHHAIAFLRNCSYDIAHPAFDVEPATGCAIAARRRDRSPVVSELVRTSQRRSGRPQWSQGNRQTRRHVESKDPPRPHFIREGSRR